MKFLMLEKISSTSVSNNMVTHYNMKTFALGLFLYSLHAVQKVSESPCKKFFASELSKFV